jgi:hypothetical protein
LILLVFFELLLRLVRGQLGVRRALRQATRGRICRARLGRRRFLLLSGASRPVNGVFVLTAHEIALTLSARLLDPRLVA